jgi:hypothetical protein
MPVERSRAFLEVFENTMRFCSMENSEGAALTGLAYTPRLTNDIAALMILVLIEVRTRKEYRNMWIYFASAVDISERTES